MDRYRVTLKPGSGSVFGILDTDRYDYCGLPDTDGQVQPLEWPAREDAERWLQMCYRRWRAWEGTKQRDIVPLRWRPRPPETSPFDRGYQFYN
jgi:hypothetical protein